MDDLFIVGLDFFLVEVLLQLFESFLALLEQTLVFYGAFVKFFLDTLFPDGFVSHII